MWGAAGFIGSHLCDRLVAEGHAVVGLDNLITGSRRNIAHLTGNPLFEFRECDVTQPFEISEPIDGVLHLASLASPRITSSILSKHWNPVQARRATCWSR